MIRGTTPRLEFTLPISTDDLSESFVTIAQNGQVIINKQLNECTKDDKKLIVDLSQEETLQLVAGQKVEIQLRCKTNDDKALASEIITTTADRILKEGVI